MNQKFTLLFLLCASLFCTTIKAQNCDPWIIRAYEQLYGKKPSAQECNISNYNNGRWGSYVELVGHIASFNRYRPGNHLKGDPWIFMAYVDLYNRGPKAIELNIQAYNNGKWGSYDELKRHVQTTQNAFSNAGITIKEVTDCSGNRIAKISIGGKQAMDVLSNEEGRILAKGSDVYNFACEMLRKADDDISKLANNKMMQGFTFHFKSGRRVLSANSQVVPTSGTATLVIE